MKKMTLASLSVVSAMSLGTASAPAATPPATSWTGAYGGLSVGYQDAEVQNDAYTLSYFGLTGTPDPNGAIAGGFAGYNVQLPASDFVIGAEASLDIGSHKDSTVPSGFGLIANAHVAGQAAVTGRIGYTGYAGFMPWVQAGLVAGRTEYSVTFTGGPFGGNHGTQTAYGPILGAGVDYAIGGPLFARVSYSYSHLGAETFVRDQTGESFDLNDFKLGLGFRF